MVRGFWTGTAAGLVLAVTGLSMCMNFAFGYGLGTSEGTGQMLGALSVAFDGLKALLPLFIAWQWRDRRWVRAGAGGVLFVLVAAYGMASALGFSSQNREDVTASREHLNASLKEHLGDLELAERRLKALGPHRIAGAVEADIARLKKDRPWDATSGCTDATLAASREFCKRIDTLRAEARTRGGRPCAHIEDRGVEIQGAAAARAGRRPRGGPAARRDRARGRSRHPEGALGHELAACDRGRGGELLWAFRDCRGARAARSRDAS